MRLLAAIATLVIAAVARGQVVIDMPAPPGIPQAASTGEPTPAVGEVALQRYAWGRAGPLYRSGGPWWGYPYPRYAYWGYPWYGYAAWPVCWPRGYWGWGFTCW